MRQLINDGHITVAYCPTDQMLADMLTKPLEATKLTTLAKTAMNSRE